MDLPDQALALVLDQYGRYETPPRLKTPTGMMDQGRVAVYSLKSPAGLGSLGPLAKQAPSHTPFTGRLFQLARRNVHPAGKARIPFLTMNWRREAIPRQHRTLAWDQTIHGSHGIGCELSRRCNSNHARASRGDRLAASDGLTLSAVNCARKCLRGADMLAGVGWSSRREVMEGRKAGGEGQSAAADGLGNEASSNEA